MWTTIVSAVISIVTWIVDKNQKARISTEKYIDYIQKWIKNTPTGSEVSDDHDELMNRDINEDDNVQ